MDLGGRRPDASAGCGRFHESFCELCRRGRRRQSCSWQTYRRSGIRSARLSGNLPGNLTAEAGASLPGLYQREQERDSRTGQDRSVCCRSDDVAQALRGAFYADDRRAGADDQRSGGALHRDQSLPRLPDVLPERSLQPRIPVPDDRGAGVCRPGVLFRQQALRDGYLGAERTLFRNHLSEGVALRGPRRSGIVLLRYFRSRLRLCRGPGLRLALPGARQTAA